MFEALPESKTPPKAFVKQANIAEGPLQVIVRAVVLNPWPVISARVSWSSWRNAR
jgi:hypothetical protein